MKPLKEVAKKYAFRYTKLGQPHYRYQTEPVQLAEIVLSLEAVLQGRTTPATIVEIGVARGMTTRFLCQHLVAAGHKVRYIALDTFSSFTDDDLAFEETHRGKSRDSMAQFQYNDVNAWRRNFTDFPFVEAIQGDCGAFDYATIGPIDFCFLDVDLYKPTLSGLERLWPNMADRSILMVDDVNAGHALWDGAHQAFMEFSQTMDLPYRLIGNKCGMFWKNPEGAEPPVRALNIHQPHTDV